VRQLGDHSAGGVRAGGPVHAAGDDHAHDHHRHLDDERRADDDVEHADDHEGGQHADHDHDALHRDRDDDDAVADGFERARDGDRVQLLRRLPRHLHRRGARLTAAAAAPSLVCVRRLPGLARRLGGHLRGAGDRRRTRVCSPSESARDHELRRKPWDGGRVTFVAAPSYTGPVLIRGGEVGGAGVAGFGEGRTPVDELQLLTAATTSTGEPTGARQWPSFARVRQAGCYAYQVDGTSFSEVIVFQATS
jgi:hypothetical protein